RLAADCAEASTGTASESRMPMTPTPTRASRSVKPLLVRPAPGSDGREDSGIGRALVGRDVSAPYSPALIGDSCCVPDPKPRVLHLAIMDVHHRKKRFDDRELRSAWVA